MKTFIFGFTFTLSLISAIGPQNTFIIRQGFIKKHVLATTTLCILCDALLCCFGVFVVGNSLKLSPALNLILTLFAVALLTFYAYSSFKAAFKKIEFDTSAVNSTSLQTTILTCLGFTLLNPHVYIDTIILTGSISSILAPELKGLFILGGILASSLWFYCIGFGAKVFSSYFKINKLWNYINFIIGCLMIYSIIEILR